MQGVGMEVETLSPEERQLLRRIRVRKVQLKAAHQRRKAVANNAPTLPRGADTQRNLTTGNMRVRARPSLLAVLMRVLLFVCWVLLPPHICMSDRQSCWDRLTMSGYM